MSEKWVRLHKQTRAINLSRCRNVEQDGKSVIYVFHTEAQDKEHFDTESEAAIRFGQILGLLGASA